MMIFGTVRVTSIVDKLREERLRWLKHVKRRYIDVPARSCEQLAMVRLRRSRGRMKKNRGELIRQDMTHLQLT